MSGYRYGPYTGGPDPLEPPYDVRGRGRRAGRVGAGGHRPGRGAARPAAPGHVRAPRPGRPAAPGARAAARGAQPRPPGRHARAGPGHAGQGDRRRSGPSCSPTPATTARMREAELDSVPSDTARAIRQLSDYDWQSADGPADVRGAQGPAAAGGAGQPVPGHEAVAWTSPTQQAMQRVKDMMSALTQMLEADARGEHDAAGLRRLHGRVRGHVPGLPGQPGGAGRLAGPPDAGGAAAARVAQRRPARASWPA